MENFNSDLHSIHLKVAKEQGKLWYFIKYNINKILNKQFQKASDNTEFYS
jgi:hypothetical protein